MTEHAISGDSKKLFWMFVGCACAMSFAQLTSWISPYMVSSLLELKHFSPGQGGLALTVEFLMTGIVSVVFANIVLPFNYRQIALAGAVLALVSDWFSGYADSLSQILVLRGLAGCGEGLVLMSASALAAEFANPDKAFGWMNMASVIVGVAAMYTFPLLAQTGAQNAGGGLFVFKFACFISLLLLPFMWWISRRKVPVPVQGVACKQKHLLQRRLAWGICMLTPLASVPIFTFATELGTAARVPSPEIETLLTISIIGSLFGAAYVSFVGKRFGRFLPTSIVAVAGLASVLSVILGSSDGFRVALVVVMLMAYVIVPLMLGVLAELDESGRSAATGAGLFAGGFALAPAAAGYIIENFGVFAICYFSTGAFVLLILTVFKLKTSLSSPLILVPAA